MSMPEQNLKNHIRLDPVFHYGIAAIFLLNIIFCVIHVFYQPGWFSGWLIVVAVGLMLLAFKTRTYPLLVQDRVIRLEERLRLSLLAPADLRARIPELSHRQLIALRFASDEELPTLAAQALDEHLGSKEIKLRIRSWRADHLRV